MNRRKLTEELARRPLLCDGAMGTQLMAAGLKPGSCGELWNVDNAPAVEVIHHQHVWRHDHSVGAARPGGAVR